MIMLRRFRFLQQCHSTFYRTQKAQYARRSRFQFPETDFDRNDLHEFKEIEEMEDFFDVENMQHLHETRREEEHSRQYLTKKIIEQKFFRPPQELNLLTWDAKEQIRYLHQEYPEEWTIERLSDSFPISSRGVRQLLRSRYQPKTLEDLLKHDGRVRKNWKDLLAAGKGQASAGPIVERYMYLKDSGQLELMKHAAGIQQLPKPDWTRRLLSHGVSQAEQPRKIGTFESIVKDYCDQKKKLEKISNSEQVLITNCCDENRRILTAVVENKMINPGEEKTKSNMLKVDHVDPNKDNRKAPAANKVGYESSEQIDTILESGSLTKRVFQKESEPRKHLGKQPNSLRRRRPQTMFDVFRETDDEDSAHKNDKKIKQKVADQISLNHQIQLGMEGTSKLGGNPAGNKVWDWRKTTNENRPKIHIQYDNTKNSDSDAKEHFMYDSETGYQHPFGKRMEEQNIKVPARKKQTSNQETVVYHDGKTVYDEDGEFLYRIP